MTRLLTIPALVLGALVACGRPEPPPERPVAPAPAEPLAQVAAAAPASSGQEVAVPIAVDPAWITARQLIERRSAGQPTVALDVRPPAAFERGRLKGSINLKLHELRASAAARTGHAVIISGGHEGDRLLRRVDQLREAGVEVRVLLGGMQAWCRASGAVEGRCEGADVISAVDTFSEAREPDRAVLVALRADDPTLDERAALASKLIPGARVVPYDTPADLTAAARDLANEPGMRLLTVTDADGSGYADIRAALGQTVDAHLYYLEGGLSALQLVVDRQTAMWNRKSIVSQGTRGGAGSRGGRDVIRAPKGCGCL